MNELGILFAPRQELLSLFLMLLSSPLLGHRLQPRLVLLSRGRAEDSHFKRLLGTLRVVPFVIY